MKLSAWREDGSQPVLAYFKLGKAVRDLIAFVETRRASWTSLARKLPPSAKPEPPVTQAQPRPRKARTRASGADGQQSLF